MNVLPKMTEISQLAFLPADLTETATAARDAQFSLLVERQSRFVFRVAYSILRNATDSEDAAQETFLRLYRSGAWERMEDERAFLARTVWRIAVDLRTRQRPANREIDSPSPIDPEQSAMQSARTAAVHRLIDALPEELRQPLALSTVSEMTSNEIAKIMRIPEGTVRTRLMRARHILKRKLETLAGTNPGTKQ